VARLHLRQSPQRRRVMADLRRFALAWSLPSAMPRLLQQHLPPGCVYLNVGHTNLSAEVFMALHGIAGARGAVLLHDVIPLTHPQFTRGGTSKEFAAKCRVICACADLVIYNSHDSQINAERIFDKWGRVPPSVVAHLGVALAPPTAPPAAALPGFDPSRPYFVTLGTIEPRKNHVFLLDLWLRLAEIVPPKDMPQLCIIGARGWLNDALFARLDREPAHIHEFADLSDGAVTSLLQNARALLFPSFAEGFGLPALEAGALGVSVICSDLPVFREVMRDYPVYAPVDQSYLWIEEIVSLMGSVQQDDVNNYLEVSGSWAAHFEIVFARA
jgi:glycosyltransferase involved in cell wall biosynthesis